MILPKIHEINDITFPLPDNVILKNNISLFGYNGAKNAIIRIDLLFNSGRWTEPEKLVAECTAKLFKSGTNQLSSYQLNEQIDGYGSTIRASAGYNTFTVSLYCMHRFLEPSLQLLLTCLTELVFPKNELELLQKNAIEKLKINKEKNDYLADVAFKKIIFGEAHPYGYETTNAAINNITQTLLLQHYHHDIHPQNCTVFIAGKYDTKEINLIDQYIGNWKSEYSILPKKEFTQHHTEQKNIRIKKEKSVQASIIIGKTLFTKQHQDYAAFILLNTIFGGFFGSRLMSNIREEKGLTYGIHSGLSTLKYGSIFSIQTDTNIDKVELCLNEIYLELARLQNELIPLQELTIARNYLLGKFLSRTDGPFNQMEIFKSYFIEELDINKFEEITETIKQTDAVSLQQLAQKYLQKESMLEVVGG